jgi:hypothetical protein
VRVFLLLSRPKDEELGVASIQASSGSSVTVTVDDWNMEVRRNHVCAVDDRHCKANDSMQQLTWSEATGRLEDTSCIACSNVEVDIDEKIGSNATAAVLEEQASALALALVQSTAAREEAPHLSTAGPTTAFPQASGKANCHAVNSSGTGILVSFLNRAAHAGAFGCYRAAHYVAYVAAIVLLLL